MRLTVVIRKPGRAPFRAVSLDDLSNIICIQRRRMGISRDELKKLRLAAKGVVGAQMDASSEMYGRIINAGSTVDEARKAAETAHMGALQEQLADLNEMAEEMSEFAQAVPSGGGGTGTRPPAKATAAPSAGTAALAALNAAQPAPKAWGSDGSETQVITAAEVGAVEEALASKPDQLTVNGVSVK